MKTAWSAAPFVPERGTLRALRESSRACEGCPLYARATQTVFGEGRATARVILVGEQPGNDEDLEGRPFVGPAGGVLDRALERAGIDRREVYVTNVVKHFKWVPKGRRRMHQKPSAAEIGACLPWLMKEIELVRPDVLVCLGATAAQAVLGRGFRVSVDRGKVLATPPGRAHARDRASILDSTPENGSGETPRNGAAGCRPQDCGRASPEGMTAS